VKRVLRDHRTAPIDAGTRAVLELVRKVTLAPGEVGVADADAARAAGVSDAAIEDALYIAAYFNLVDRVADALGFDLPTPEEHADYAPQFYEEGYGNEV
jgi:alkylhydroperoxidase family enzyme